MTKLAVLKRERRKNNNVARPHTRYVNCGTFWDYQIFPLLTTANYYKHSLQSLLGKKTDDDNQTKKRKATTGEEVSFVWTILGFPIISTFD